MTYLRFMFWKLNFLLSAIDGIVAQRHKTLFFGDFERMHDNFVRWVVRSRMQLRADRR